MKTSNTSMKSFAILGLALAFILGSCSNTNQNDTQKASNETNPAAQITFDLIKAKQEIQTANDAFTDLVAQHDSIGLTNMYTTDAKFMMGGGPSATGHKEIQSAMHNIFRSGITDAKIITKEIFGNADLLVEESNVLLYAGDQQVADEKALVVWKKVDDEWKLFRDIFNSNLPPNEE